MSIVGADHVKFGGGFPIVRHAAGLELDKVRTVILTPSAVDTAGPQLETCERTRPCLDAPDPLAAAAGDGGIPVIGGDAVVDVAAAARVLRCGPVPGAALQ